MRREAKPSHDRLDPVSKLVIGLSLLAATCLGCVHPTAPVPAPYRIPGFQFAPPPLYVAWFAQAHNCAARLRELLGDSAAFTVESEAVDVNRITWIAVPTERPDGRFLGMFSPKRDSIYVWGLTAVRGDTIWLPAQRLESSVIVKHEAMHVFVQSPSELNFGPHGLPWGFCEWL